MKILFFDTWLAPFHVGTALEIAENHMAEGDEVHYVNISASLPFIEVHHKNKPSQHWVLRKKYNNIRKMCDGGKIPYSFQSGVSPFFHFELPEAITTVNQLKQWKYEDMDLGMSILSSLISQTNDLEPDLTQHRAFLNQIACSCIKTLKSLQYWCERFNPDRIYFVNGRTALTRPMLRYCQKMGIDLRTHELGGNENLKSYSVHTTFLHDLQSYNQLIEDHWKLSSHSEEEKINIAIQFYERLKSGKKQWIAFNNQMKQGLLPSDFDFDAYNVAFYTSSITEFASIDERNNSGELFENQFESVRFIANCLFDVPGARFYLRLHPNTKKSFPKEHSRWLEFIQEMGNKIVWLDGDSGIDSYALMLACQKIVVSYSTVGIEAPYYDKPVIATHNARYHKLGSTYFAESKEQLKSFLQNKQLPPMPKIGSYKYAYFQMTWGNPFKIYQPKNRFEGEYRQVNVDAVHLTAIDHFIMKLLDKFNIQSL